MSVFYWNTKEKEYTLHFEGTPTVAELLREKGIPFSAPCGGNGTCGKCAIAINGSISVPDAREKALKTRLACRTVLTGDAWGAPLCRIEGEKMKKLIVVLILCSLLLFVLVTRLLG